MSEGLLKGNIKESLEEIVSHCFYCNRMLDRICSILSTKFVMSNMANILHLNLAHRYPLLADDISEYMDGRDCTVIYKETPAGDQEYQDVLSCLNFILQINLELENKISASIKETEKENDYTTKVYLEKYLLKIIPITRDIMLLVDKAEMYGESSTNIMKLDNDIKDFGLFNLEN